MIAFFFSCYATIVMYIVVVQSLSHIWLWPQGLQSALQASVLHFSQSLFKLMSIDSMRASNHLIFCCPLLLLTSTFPSIRVFPNESALHIRWPKYWSFSFTISPSNEYSKLISFRIDWFDLLAVQGTLKSLLQPHSSKTSILWYSPFFMVQFFLTLWEMSFPEFLSQSFYSWL